MKYIIYKKALWGLLFFPIACIAQITWKNRTPDYGPLPPGMELYSFEGNYQNKPFRAFYAIADPGSPHLRIEHDTTKNRRITPTEFFKKNNEPVLVVNTSFFSFKDNLNLNIIVNKGKLLAYNNHTIPMRGADSGLYYHPFVSALGINKKGEMDVAWTFTAKNKRKPYATGFVFTLFSNEYSTFSLKAARYASRLNGRHTPSPKPRLSKWKMYTVVGGGPVLVQNNAVVITNNEEWKFAGKAIQDAHPRTAMGYTKEGKLIVLVIEGRNQGIAAGATLEETASILVELGCIEALNLDGGGSSCMLINGKETIKPSDKEGQRAVPAALIWKK